jgi:predicted phosphate transport protein (TIGR00153 family)
LKSFKRFLVVGEENIFGRLSQIIAIAAEANQSLIGMLDDCKNGMVLDRGVQAIKGLENKADEVAFKINENITAGAVSPNILDNLLECVRVADDIVDTYFYQSRELARMHKAKFPYSEEIEDTQWIAIFKSMLELANQALAKVQQILANSDLSRILELRKEIEALEQQGDEIKDKSFDVLYQEAPRMHYLQFYHYSELLHKFDDILDGCEDLSDLVLSIITSILK